MPPPAGSFGARLVTVDDGTLTAFVAAVYAARGWTVDREGDDLRATPPGSDRPRRLVVTVGDGDPPDTAAVVDGADRIDVDAATLHELVAYALPAAERTRLCREFLDREFDAFGPPPTTGRPDARSDRSTAPPSGAETTGPPRDRGDGSSSGDGHDGRSSADTSTGADGRDATPRRERVARAAVVVVALSLVVGGLLTAAGPGLAGSAAIIGGDGAPDGAGERRPAANGSSPSGLDADGVGSARRLADAHAAALDGRSFRLRIVYREYDDGSMRGVAHERAVVAASGRYRSAVRRIGTIEHGSTVLGAPETYSDGERRYVRSTGGDGDAAGESPRVRSSSTTTVRDPVRLVDRTERYVRWYLGVTESRRAGTIERDGTTLYAIDFEGDPWPAATAVSGRALVGETGIVREIRRTHVPRGDRSVRIEISIRIVPERVTVTRPDWVPSDEPRHGVAYHNGTASENETDERPPRPSRNASGADSVPTRFCRGREIV
jgi:hypothetical protein